MMMKILLASSLVFLSLAGCGRFEANPRANGSSDALKKVSEPSTTSPPPIAFEAPTLQAPAIASTETAKPKSETTAPPRMKAPSNLETPSTPRPPECRPDFLRAYNDTVGPLMTAGTYLQVNETPPNLREAVRACNTIATKYPARQCYATMDERILDTTIFEELCALILDMDALEQEKKRNSDVSSVIPNVAPTEPALYDATPIIDLKDGKLSMRITNLAEVQKAVNKPRSTFIINGVVLDLKASIPVFSSVRCTMLKAVSNSPPTTVLAKDVVLAATEVSEIYDSGYRVTTIALDNSELGIQCGSETGQGITLGELRATFAGLLEIAFVK